MDVASGAGTGRAATKGRAVSDAYKELAEDYRKKAEASCYVAVELKLARDAALKALDLAQDEIAQLKTENDQLKARENRRMQLRKLVISIPRTPQ